MQVISNSDIICLLSSCAKHQSIAIALFSCPMYERIAQIRGVMFVVGNESAEAQLRAVYSFFGRWEAKNMMLTLNFRQDGTLGDRDGSRSLRASHRDLGQNSEDTIKSCENGS